MTLSAEQSLQTLVEQGQRGDVIDATLSVSIANAGTTSTAFSPLGSRRLAALLPASFAGTQLTFSVSPDDATYGVLYNLLGEPWTVPIASDASAKAVDLPEEVTLWPYIKLVSNVVQSGAKTVQIRTKS